MLVLGGLEGVGSMGMVQFLMLIKIYFELIFFGETFH